MAIWQFPEVILHQLRQAQLYLWLDAGKVGSGVLLVSGLYYDLGLLMRKLEQSKRR
jgi:hypothetical protein